MTLFETIRVLEAVASKQPAVNGIVRQDVSRLNEWPEARYGVFCWQQGTHYQNADGDIARYAFTLFYIDRLTEDKANAAEVQSTGCEVLGSILRYLAENEVGVEEWALHPFTYRFKDECAGVWAEVVLDVPIDLPCGAIYTDLEYVWDEDAEKWVPVTKEREILIY